MPRRAFALSRAMITAISSAARFQHMPDVAAKQSFASVARATTGTGARGGESKIPEARPSTEDRPSNGRGDARVSKQFGARRTRARFAHRWNKRCLRRVRVNRMLGWRKQRGRILGRGWRPSYFLVGLTSLCFLLWGPDVPRPVACFHTFHLAIAVPFESPSAFSKGEQESIRTQARETCSEYPTHSAPSEPAATALLDPHCSPQVGSRLDEEARIPWGNPQQSTPLVETEPIQNMPKSVHHTGPSLADPLELASTAS